MTELQHLIKQYNAGLISIQELDLAISLIDSINSYGFMIINEHATGISNGEQL